MKSMILFLCFGYFLVSGVFAKHHGHRRARQPHLGHHGPPGHPPPGHPPPGHPPNAPIDLEVLDALGIPRPPVGQMVMLNVPDQARYNAYMANKGNVAAAPLNPVSSDDQNTADGNPYNADGAGVDPNTLEKDKEEIIEELEKRADQMIAEEGDVSYGFNGGNSIKTSVLRTVWIWTISLLTFIMI